MCSSDSTTPTGKPSDLETSILAGAFPTGSRRSPETLTDTTSSTTFPSDQEWRLWHNQHQLERAAQALRALRQEEDLSLWGSREIVDFVVEAMYV